MPKLLLCVLGSGSITLKIAIVYVCDHCDCDTHWPMDRRTMTNWKIA